MYDKIQSDYNYYIFSKNKSINKTQFIKNLASTIGTTLSNIYEIIKVGLIEVYDYDLNIRTEFSAQVAWNKKTKKSIESNSSKRESSKVFINLVIKEFRSDYNINSINEIINDFNINRKDEIKGMVTICTSTFYNYVEDNKIEGFSEYELPMKTKRKKKKERKDIQN